MLTARGMRQIFTALVDLPVDLFNTHNVTHCPRRRPKGPGAFFCLAKFKI